ncbi:MAG: hypothetical protein KJ737_01720 [Proteobacteria bacterium]|nr:hypothetical protein [Pseudomonadota bacterium]
MNSFKVAPGGRKYTGKSEELLSLLIADILKTRETKQVLGVLIPEIIRNWAGESRFKQKITKPVEGFVKRKLTQHSNGAGEITLPSLFEDPRLADMLRQFLPEIVHGLVNATGAVIKNAEALPYEERKAFYSDMIAGINQSSFGELLTLALKTANEIHQENPQYFTEKLESGAVKLIEGIDVGELRDFFDNSKDDIDAFVKMILGIFWQYPSKLVLLLTFITDIVNILSMSFSEFLSVLNRISPDLLTDVVFSIFRGINGRSIGKLVNEGAEIIRKFHTGNALIGEPGTTQLPIDLGKFMEDILSVIDNTALWKAKLALAEEKEIVFDVLRKVLKEDPDRFEKRLTSYSLKKNSQIRELNNKFSAIENLPEENVADAIEKTAMNMETEEAAEVVNLFMLLINRIRSLKPGIASGLVSRFVNSLDLFELRDGLNGIGEDLSDDLMPLGRAIIPKLVTGICKTLEPMDDEYEEDAAEARQLLRSLLAREEIIP